MNFNIANISLTLFAKVKLLQKILNLQYFMRGSYMSAEVLLNLYELRKTDKMRGLPSILSFFATNVV